MKDERCENKYSSGTVKGLAIERCYRGESIEKSTLPVKDSSDGLEYPNKLYEGSVV